jgi:hypothetical protein
MEWARRFTTGEDRNGTARAPAMPLRQIRERITTAPYETGGESRRLGARGRRVLEDGSAEEERGNPARSEYRNRRNVIGKLRRRKDVWRSRMLVTARRDQCHGALVIRCAAVLMNPCVQLRRGGKRKREEKRADECRSGEANVYLAIETGLHLVRSLHPSGQTANQINCDIDEPATVSKCHARKIVCYA